MWENPSTPSRIMAPSINKMASGIMGLSLAFKYQWRFHNCCWLCIYNYGTTGEVYNNGTISCTHLGSGATCNGILNGFYGTITTLINDTNGTITANATEASVGIENNGTISTITNRGIINAGSTIGSAGIQIDDNTHLRQTLSTAAVSLVITPLY